MSDNDAIVKRLDVLIALMVENLRTQAKIPQAQLFKTIRDTGLTPAEIGNILNKDGKYVSAKISEFEKSKTKSKNNKKTENSINTNVLRIKKQKKRSKNE